MNIGWLACPRLTFFLLALPLSLGAGESQAGSPRGREVVVVYNARAGSTSRLIAEHYAQLRGVPPTQVIPLRLPEGETMTRTEYRRDLEEPLLAELQKRGLWQLHSELIPGPANEPATLRQVPIRAGFRYLVLVYGVPLRVAADPSLVEPETEHLAADMRRNEAAVDSELATLPAARAGRHFAGALRNPAYGTTNTADLAIARGLIMVTRLDGPTPRIAQALVDKAIQAETQGLNGRTYFDARGLTNGSYKIGDDWIIGAARSAQIHGFETLLDLRPETFRASFPMPQIALYAGWYATSPSGPFTRPTVEFQPGAVAYHLFSYSARTVRAPTSWVGTLLAKGATATMGCVEEPYLETTPNVDIFFSRLLDGFTFGEAAYASINALSWQTTVIGDPLYRPFPPVDPADPSPTLVSGTPAAEWNVLQAANLRLLRGGTPPEVAGTLTNAPAFATSAVLQQKLGDLNVLQGHLAEAAEAYQVALRLNPSPQQRIHLQWGTARLLKLLGQPAGALKFFEDFFQANPDYPDLSVIYEEALPVARAAGRSDLATHFEEQIARLKPQPEPSAPAK